MKKKPFRLWQVTTVNALGILVSCYWLVNGIVQITGLDALTWLKVVMSVIPGVGLLLMVIMARRYPIPYGTGFILAGVLLLLTRFFRPEMIKEILFLSLPLMVVGGLFIWINPYISMENKKNQIH